MPIKIYKYPLVRTSLPQAIQMPVNSTVLKTVMSDGIFCIWAMVATEVITEYRTFVIISTGESIDYPISSMVYIDTIFTSDLVFHIFELKNYDKRSNKLNSNSRD
ncbi:DUF7352 domain-containing protein [Dysgonomonas capnocytophagoides]